jgi:hypothetical protein
MRRWRYGILSIVALVAVLGATMVGLHGYGFFVFRNAGTGQSPSDARNENQGPGQPDAFTLKATMPDGKVITMFSPVDNTWAGVAQLRDGEWAVLAAGLARSQVTTATASSWQVYERLYRSAWTIVPVRQGVVVNNEDN